MVWISAGLCILLLSTLGDAAEKQVKLQDIERDNLDSKQRSQKQYQQEQDQSISDQPGLKQEISPQTYIAPEQQYSFQPQQQILAYPQVPNVALYPAFLAPGAAPALQSNHLGGGGYLLPGAAPALQNTHLGGGGYLLPGAAPTLQNNHLGGGGILVPDYRAAAPASPLYYPQAQGIQLVYPAPVPAATLPQQPVVNQSPKASFTHQSPVVKHSAELTLSPTFRSRGFQPPRPLDIQQSNFNPIPRELQSYTTIPDSVYQGREPAYSYDTAPAVSLTTDQQNQYNQQQQRQLPQRPVFGPGVKTVVPVNQLKSGTFPINGNVPGATRHFPGSGVSFTAFRRVPSSF